MYQAETVVLLNIPNCQLALVHRQFFPTVSRQVFIAFSLTCVRSLHIFLDTFAPVAILTTLECPVSRNGMII